MTISTSTIENTIRPYFIDTLIVSPLKDYNYEAWIKALSRAKTCDLDGLIIMSPLLGKEEGKKFKDAIFKLNVYIPNKRLKPTLKQELRMEAPHIRKEYIVGNFEDSNIFSFL